MSDERLTVQSEGGLLPPDLLLRIAGADAELGGFEPGDYGLAPTDQLREAAARAWAKAKLDWAAFQGAVGDLPTGESGVTETREQWLLPLLRNLGYRDVVYQAAAKAVGDRRYAISHESGPVSLHLVGCRQELDQAEGGAGSRRRASPHTLVQEYLNASDSVYGLVSNGRTLRLLRDNASLTRQAYVELDLEGMLDGSRYGDFVLMYLALHRSRLPRAGEPAGDCWLERWREKAETQGARALGELRRGVEQAIEAMGRGFLRHRDNDELRRRLKAGELPVGDYYRQLLRLVYRLIFLFVAEERHLIFPDGAGERDQRRYMEHYAVGRLRELAPKLRTDDRHDDLWRALRVTFGLLSGEVAGLGVPPLGGGLFDAGSCPDLDRSLLPNDALADALVYLSWVKVAKVTRRVNYRDINVEELGGVYEGLLDRHPRLRAERASPEFALVTAGGGERKQTGSYYTPTALVQELVKSALVPVLAGRLAAAKTAEEKRSAILSIAVCDPACGSGHFLLAAARRLAGELARVEADGGEPAPPQLRQALRDVIRTCLYGVDANPLAVDLCKLALWIEGHEPGRVLTFLDHRVKLGNSLIGATWELLRDGVPEGAFAPVAGDQKELAQAYTRLNRQELKGQAQFVAGEAIEEVWRKPRAAYAEESARIGGMPEDGPTVVREQQTAYEAFSTERLKTPRETLDAWAAAFFWPLRDGAVAPPTTSLLREALPDHAPALQTKQREEVERLRRQHHFFHWPLEFPDVFERHGGFDCVLGNPPWERIKLQQQEFFAERDEEIAKAANKAARERKIAALKGALGGKALYAEYEAALRDAEAQSKFVRQSGRFPLTAVGDVNLYALFAEHARSILNGRGRAGIIVPTGIATDDTTKRFFQEVVSSESLVSYFGFKNEQHLFPLPVEHTVTFGLLTLLGPGQSSRAMEFTWLAYNTDHMHDPGRRIVLDPDDLTLMNPNTGTCPVFRTKEDAELTRAIYRRVPVLVNEATGENPWELSFLAMFHMSNDSGLFHTSPAPGRVPLYEAKMFHQFDHRWATYDGKDARDLTDQEKADPSRAVTPRYWVDRAKVEEKLAGRWERGWLLVFRDIARNTDERTAIFSVLPRVGVGHTAPLGLPDCDKAPLLAALLGNMDSVILDYVARQKVGGTHLTYSYLNQLAVLPPSTYSPPDLGFTTPRVLELVYNAQDLQPFARDLGYGGPPFAWDPERRAVLRAELDAYYAALYGLTRDELRYILDPSDVYGPAFPGETFRVLKDREKREHGEYRTRRLTLEAWDRLGLGPRNRDGRYAASSPGATAAKQSRPAEPAPPPATPAPAARRQRLAFPGEARQPGLMETTGAPEPAPDPLRERVLRRAVDVLASAGPLSARELAQRLAPLDARIDRQLVASVLGQDGAGRVRYDAASGRYRVGRR